MIAAKGDCVAKQKKLPQRGATKQLKAKRGEPRISRPVMPQGYAIPTHRAGLLSWRWVESRFRNAHNYWVATVGSDGAPHAVPIWGVWVEGTFYFGTDRGARKARNLRQEPRVVVHLESGDETVIMNGRAEEFAGGPLMRRIDQAYVKKYKLRMSDSPGDLTVFAVTPLVFLAWRESDFPKSTTRMVFSR